MSQATPFIAKITISSSAGQYADPDQGFTVFALYDNSGNTAPPPAYGSVASTCVMRGGSALTGAAGGTSAAVLTLPHGGYWATVGFNPALSDVVTFDYSFGLAFMTLTVGAPPLSGYQGGIWSVYQLIFSWSDPTTYYMSWAPTPLGVGRGNAVALCGFSVNLVTPGGMFLGRFAGSLNPYILLCSSQGMTSIPLDFDGVDLSGENYSGAFLAAAPTTIGQGPPPNPFHPQPAPWNLGGFIPLISTWRYAVLSNTNFAGNTLGNATFDHAVMNGTNFRGATLYQATFHGATGTGPDFSGAICSGSNGLADFSNAAFPDADFSNADLRGVHFNHGDFTNANFTGALLQGAVFDHATLANADFSGAQLQGTQFTNTDVSQAVFSANAQFSVDPSNRTSFAGSAIAAGMAGNNWAYLDLSGASFQPKPATITNLNAQSARLCGFDFSGINFIATNPSTSPTNFANAILAQADFSNTSLNSAVFSSANAEPDSQPSSPFTGSATFSGANLEDTQFDGASLSGVDFSYALLWGGQATLSQATLTDANFANAYLASAKFTDLKDAQCGGVVFTGACLVNASFSGTTLQQGAKGGMVIFDGAFLQGAEFSEATFGAVSLNGAVLATQPGNVTPSFATPPRGTQPIFPIHYQPTLLPPSQTTAGTICVDGTPGSCSAAAIAPPNPMPASWNRPRL